MTKKEIIETVREYLGQGDLDGARLCVGNIAMGYQTFNTSEAEEYRRIAKKLMNECPQLFEGYDGAPLGSKTKTVFEKGDFSDAVFGLKQNLCMERIEDVIAVGRAVYGKNTPPDNRQSQPQHSRPKPDPTPGSGHRAQTTIKGTASKKASGASANSQSNPPLLPLILIIVLLLIGAAALLWLLLRK